MLRRQDCLLERVGLGYPSAAGKLIFVLLCVCVSAHMRALAHDDDDDHDHASCGGVAKWKIKA